MQTDESLSGDQTSRRIHSKPPKRKLSEAYEQIHVGVVESSLDGKYISCNEAFCSLLGYERPDLLKLCIEDVTYAQDYSIEAELLKQLLAGSIPFYNIKKRYLHKDGHLVWVEFTQSLLRNSKGKALSTVGTAVNITERQFAENNLVEFARRQEALYKLADKLHSADSLEEVFNAGLDAILDALRCDRASILLFDTSNVMRFVAWRELSSAYREATDGHSPWKWDEQQPVPICIENVSTGELSDVLRSVIANEGIGSLAFIPLMSKERLIGKFMVYFNGPHQFLSDDVELSLTIARQLALGIQRKWDDDEMHRLNNKLETQLSEMKMLLDILPTGVWIGNQDLSVITGNPAAYEMLGLPSGINASVTNPQPEVPGGLRFFIEGVEVEPENAPMQQVARTAKPLYNLEHELLFADGTRKTVYASIVPVLDRLGRVQKVIGAYTDFSEQKRVGRELAFMAELGDKIRSANDADELIKFVCELTGKYYGASHCSFSEINLVEDLLTNKFEYKLEDAPSVLGKTRLSDYPAKQIDDLSKGKAVYIEDAATDQLTSSKYETLYRPFGYRAYLALPVLQNDVWVGTLFVNYLNPHRWTESEINLLSAVAERTWLAMQKLRSEKAMKTSENLYRAIARSIPNGGVYVVDRNFRYIIAEGTITEAFGLSREILEGHTIYEALPADQSARMEGRLKKSFAGEIVSFETKHNERVYWTQQAPLTNSLDYVIIVTIDITDRKRMEESLRESEARLSAILNQATAGIVRKKLDGTLAFVNQAFASMLGYTSSELVDRSIWEFTHPEDIEENKRLYRQLMMDGQPFQLEKRLIRRDSSILWVNVSVAPILDYQDMTEDAIAVEVDITSRKEAESALQALNAQLESRVEKRTAQLQQAVMSLRENRRRLMEVQEEERQFIARELHDRVGQALTALNLNLTIIQNELPDQIPELLGKRLADSISLLEATIPATRDVMANLRPSILDEEGLKVALRSLIKDFTARHGIQVKFESPDGVRSRYSPTIEIGVFRIAQEALFNVAKHAKADQVILSLQTEEKIIYLSVEDNGIGMDLSQSNAQSRGYGLTIMRERAESLGGSLQISSQIGRGTRIETRIPIEEQDTK